MSIHQKINFIEKLEEDDGATFFIAEKQQKTILNFSLDYGTLSRKCNIVNDQTNVNYDAGNEMI